MAVDDNQLITRCREGSEEAYRQLFALYEGYIYSLCYRFTGNREDALDLTQEVMIKVIKGLGSFQLNRPFKPWLRRVTINVCSDFLKGRCPPEISLEQPLDGNLTLADTIAGGEDPALKAEWCDARHKIKSVLSKMPPLFRTAIILRHQENMSYQDIADSMNLPLNTVKTYLFRARGLLRKELAETYGWEV